MLSFEQLLYEAEYKEEKDLEDYLEDFFCPENYDDYLISEKADEEEIDSIREMFESSNSLLSRANTIYSENNYCLEAFYVIYRLAGPIEVHLMFKELLKRSCFFEELSDYKKETYKAILEIYAEYLAEVHDLKNTIRITKILAVLEGSYSRTNANRLAFAYSLLEDLDGFYEMFEEVGFNDITQYLLLMIVALKQDDQEKAKDVFDELLGKYEYARYLDYPKNLLKIDDEDAGYFYAAIEAVSEELIAVPDFFLWCANNKERALLS